MTLSEAIKKENRLAETQYDLAELCHTDEGVYMYEETAYRERGEYHEQLSMWLSVLEEIKGLVDNCDPYTSVDSDTIKKIFKRSDRRLWK